MWSLAQRLYREPESFEGKISALLAGVNSLKRQILTGTRSFHIFHGFAPESFLKPSELILLPIALYRVKDHTRRAATLITNDLLRGWLPMGDFTLIIYRSLWSFKRRVINC